MHYHLIGICGVSMSGLAQFLATKRNQVTGSDLKTCKIVIPNVSSSSRKSQKDASTSGIQKDSGQARMTSLDSRWNLSRLSHRDGNDKEKNIKIYKNHSVKNITKNIDEVIYTVAVDNPTAAGFIELNKARELGIKCTSRAKFLGRFMNEKIGIAVAGMHGKTTVSTMISLILEEAGFNPTCFIGSAVKEWKSNVRVGGLSCHSDNLSSSSRSDAVIGTTSGIQKDSGQARMTSLDSRFHGNDTGFKFGNLSEYIVAEACEYQKQMLDFRPKIAVITNLEAEHLDTYKNGMKDIRQAFKKFIRILPSNGLLVVWQEDKNLMPLTKATKCKVKRVSINKPWPGLSLKIPGRHNLLDATFAARVCHELGVPHKTIKKVLNNFTGAARRFEVKGKKNGITIIDDYGHHPTEIKNTIEAAREFMVKRISHIAHSTDSRSSLSLRAHPSESKTGQAYRKSKNDKPYAISNKQAKLIIVFQPHQQQRTKLLFNEFVKCFSGIDELIITDVYLIAGREKDTGENLAKNLVEEIKKQGINAKYIESSNNYRKIIDYLKNGTKKSDLVITQGATNIYKVGEELLK